MRSDSEAATQLYKLISNSPGLVPEGLHAYDGHITEPDLSKRTAQCEDVFQAVTALRETLAAAGFSVPRLMAGGSPTFAIHAAHVDRELSPGTFVFWDFGYGDRFPDLPFESAAVVLTRIVSKPGEKRLCMDLEHKAVASENPHPRVRFPDLPDATAVMHSEEHLVLETEHASEFEVGDSLYGIPRHICPTVALYNEALPVSDCVAGEPWPIIARARKLNV